VKHSIIPLTSNPAVIGSFLPKLDSNPAIIGSFLAKLDSNPAIIGSFPRRPMPKATREQRTPFFAVAIG
jgi:hypothetical protein